VSSVYVVATRQGVWVVQNGQRRGPFTDIGEVLDALGPSTPETEHLAYFAYAWLTDH